MAEAAAAARACVRVSGRKEEASGKGGMPGRDRETKRACDDTSTRALARSHQYAPVIEPSTVGTSDETPVSKNASGTAATVAAPSP